VVKAQSFPGRVFSGGFTLEHCRETVSFATGVIVRRFVGRTDVTIHAFLPTSGKNKYMDPHVAS
jgi:hypothetical protein